MSRMPTVFGPTSSLPKDGLPDTSHLTLMPPADSTVSDPSIQNKELTLHSKKRPRLPAPQGGLLSKKGDSNIAATSSSSVSSVYGHLAEKFMKEDDLKKWNARTDSEKWAAAVKAVTELFLHNLSLEDGQDTQSARIDKLNVDNQNLTKENKNFEKKLKQLQEDKKSVDATLKSLRSDKTRLDKNMKEKDAQISELNEKVSTLTTELSSLKLDKENGWAKEKKTLEDASYTEGFRGYLKTFMAADPSYDWSAKFGDVMAQWMAEFAIIEAEAIAAKRVELEMSHSKNSTGDNQEVPPA